MTSRLEELLDPEYLDAALKSSSEDIRLRVHECELAEDRLSYSRRLVHGRLDIVRAEIEARESGSAKTSIVERLPTILADGGRASRGGRVGLPQVPDGPDERIAGVDLTGLAEMTATELEAVVSQLSATEAEISADRRRLHKIIDALRSELVRRYRDGGADASDLMRRRP